MSLAHEPIFIWMSQYAFQPDLVYSGLIGMMLLSAIGLPIPEEVTLVSIGILAFMGQNPDMFPPPYPGAPVVNMHVAAAVAFFAVFIADFLIYSIGKKFGRRILMNPRLARVFPPHMVEKVEGWTKKYGAYACGIFRFTPGIRFPGHLACGMLHFPAWKFLLIDGLAALVSIPTQIYLIAIYGEPILASLRKFKLLLLALLAVVLLYFAYKKIREKLASRSSR